MALPQHDDAPWLTRPINRRRFVSTLASFAGAVALAPASALAAFHEGWADPLPQPPRSSLKAISHLAWVWQFSRDGSPDQIRQVLAHHGLGIALKTHDGTQWMAQYDRSPHAVTGPAQVERLAGYFEEAGVPFHAWFVAKGEDPVREARMAAEVLAAGARSIIVDLEPHAGFWRGTPAAAVAFGRELRRLSPNGWVAVSIDPRPWTLNRIPLNEFAAFSNEITPQLYWETFNTAPNIERYAQSGFSPGPEGITPRFLLEVTSHLLRPFGLPLQPTGQGASGSRWREFVEHAFAHDAEAVSVWRFGVTPPEVWPVLREAPPRPRTYVVQPGDTLSALARRWNTTVATIAEVNGIQDPNLIHVGQQLVVPRGAIVNAAPSVTPVAHVASAASGSTYTVQPGDTLTILARRWNTSVSAIAQINGIANPDLIRIGQVLRIP
jgi:LysM repeat protein